MAFFDELLAGGIAGFGKGLSEYAAMDERSRREEEARADKERLALELQRQKSADAADRLDLRRELAEVKKTGGGGGGQGLNLLQLAMQAETPEQQDKVVRLAETVGGRDMAARIADKLYGRPMMEQAITNDDEGNPLPQGAGRRPVSYSESEALKVLPRVYALVLDPAKYDDMLKGERQASMNDYAQGAAEGKSPEKAAGAFATYSNPSLNESKDDVSRAAIAQRAAEEAGRASRAGQSGDAKAGRDKATNDAKDKRAAEDRVARDLRDAENALDKATRMPAVTAGEKAARQEAIANATARKNRALADRAALFKVQRD